MPTTSPRSRRERHAASPARVDFHRTKYGHELLVDAAMVSSMPTFFRDERPHYLTFHDILIVTRGRGRYWLDGVCHEAQAGTVFFTLPGQIRQWENFQLDGACLFFTEEFLEEFFRDDRFLSNLAYFRVGRPSPELRLTPHQLRSAVRRFNAMTAEIQRGVAGAEHLLRAITYELLVTLSREYVERHGTPDSAATSTLVDRFIDLVEQSFRREHRLEFYARAVGATPGHLSHLCRTQLGHSAGRVLRRRLALEARRLLRYSDMNVGAISDALGFHDPAYFSRFLRRETGSAPSQLRPTKQMPPNRNGRSSPRP